MKAKNIHQRPIVIPKATVDILLKQRESLGLLGLYTFYYYTAIWQNTDKPRATVHFVAKGLKTGVDKIRRLRKVLLKLGMIEDIQERTVKGQVLPRYVKVNYISVPLNTRSTDNKGVNAYTISINTYSRTNSERGKATTRALIRDEKKTFEEICANQLSSIIAKKGKMSRRVGRKRWMQEIRRLETSIEKTRIKKVIKWMASYIDDEYTPKIWKAVDFREKFLRIEEAMKRVNKKAERGEQPTKYRIRKTKVGNENRKEK